MKKVSYYFGDSRRLRVYHVGPRLQTPTLIYSFETLYDATNTPNPAGITRPG